DLNGFVREAQTSYRDGEEPLTIEELLLDLVRREHVNKLINKVEHTFQESAAIRNTVDDLKLGYRNVGWLLYGFAIVTGLGGYPLLVASIDSVTFVSDQQLYLLWAFLISTAGVLVIMMAHARWRLSSQSGTYRKARGQHLVDNLRTPT
ncbi:hypothetical protein MUP59_03020, partial [Candidatus Bathyarchaeota archaeon]|nr:hypothetical protein [Candidatus Bathyarchaeota archaeon]